MSSGHTARAAALPLGAILVALKRDKAKLGVLIACTMAAVTTVFEPTYLNLSSSVIQAWPAR